MAKQSVLTAKPISCEPCNTRVVFPTHLGPTNPFVLQGRKPVINYLFDR